MESVIQFLNNQTVGAFFGAMFAYLLVQFTDMRRAKKRVRSITAEIQVNVELAQPKLQAIKGNLVALRDRNEVNDGRILPFNTLLIRQLTAEVVDQLTTDQRSCIEAICHVMEGTDGVIEECRQNAAQLTRFQNPEIVEALKKKALTDYEDAIANLNRFSEMGNMYVNGKYRELKEMKYSREKYLR